jgi:hypothetical protein
MSSEFCCEKYKELFDRMWIHVSRNGHLLELGFCDYCEEFQKGVDLDFNLCPYCGFKFR